MVTVRPATPNDAAALCRVHIDSIRGLGGTHHTDEQLEAWASFPAPDRYPIDHPNHVLLVAEVDGAVAGFAHLDLDVVDAELSKLYVAPVVARQGVATALVDELETVARNRGVDRLSVESSLNAVSFYEAAGYEKTGTHSKTLSTAEGDVDVRVVDMERRL